MDKIFKKGVEDSACEDQRFSVCRHELNPSGTMHGGELVKIIDEVAAGVALKHAGRVCLTASIDSLHFLGRIFLNDIIILKASVNRTWRTSMEIGVKVFVERKGKTYHIASAYLTFVALDENLKPTPIPKVIPKTPEQKRRFREANKRRRIRLKARPLVKN